MTGSDRPEPIDPADDSWPQEDPDLTRVVPMGTPTGAPAASAVPASTGSAAVNADDATPYAGQAADSAGQTADPAGQPAQAAGAAGWSSSGSVASSWAASDPTPAPTAAQPSPTPVAPVVAAAPSYAPEPTATAVAPPSGPTPTPYPAAPAPYTPTPVPYTQAPATGPGYATPTAAGAAAGAAAASDYQRGYGATPSYQQPYASGPAPVAAQQPGPQVIMPPATNVILPPTRIPQAESRVGINAIGSVLGILLVFGGLVLVLRFLGKLHGVTQAGSIDYLNFTWVVLGALLVALPALFVAWASWTALVPGVLVTGLTIWAMVTPYLSGGAYYIDKITGWAFDQPTLGQFAYTGQGLLVGLPLLFAGLAAVFLRTGVRRTIVSQVESLQQ